MTQVDRASPAWTRGSPVAFTFVVLLFVAARLWRLTSSCLWFDEIFSVHVSRHSWPELVRFAAADIIHPPLFYALLKIWIEIGGESILWLRLFPVLISIIALIPVWLLCRALRLTTSETNLAVLLMAVSGFLIKYSQEVRMYSLVFLLSASSLWLFLKLMNQAARNFFWPLATINLLLVYTHYYGWIL